MDADALLLASKRQDGGEFGKPGVHEASAGQGYADYLEENPTHPDAYLKPLFENLHLKIHRNGLYHAQETHRGTFGNEGPDIEEQEHAGGGRAGFHHYIRPVHETSKGTTHPAGTPHTFYRVGAEREGMSHHGVVTTQELHAMANHPSAPESFRKLVHDHAPLPPAPPAPHKLQRWEDGDEMYRKFKLARKKTAQASQHGIVHNGGHEGAVVERSAVSMALQQEGAARGVPYNSGPSSNLARDTEKYVKALRQIVNSGAAGHPAVQSYIQKARRLVAPTEGGKDEAGRFELSNTAVQPTVRELAGHLRSGLIHVADRLLARDPNHVPFAHYNPTVRAKTPNGFVELTPQQREQGLRAEAKHIGESLPAPTIKPATDETVKSEITTRVPKTPDGRPAGPGVPTQASIQRLRNRDLAEVDHPLTIEGDDKPLPLADTPGDGMGTHLKTRELHKTIAEMVLKQIPSAQIIDHLTERLSANSTPEKARAKARQTFARWLDLSRQGMTPKKLARPAPTSAERIQTGYAHIAGTNLAKHLTEIAETVGGEAGVLARAILKDGPRANLGRGVNVEPFSRLKTLLKAANHPLASRYNWDRMGRTFKLDEKVKAFVEKHVGRPDGMSDRDYWSKVLSKYSTEAKDHAHKSEFWRRAGQHFDADELKKLNDSMYRHHTLEDAREDYHSALDEAHEQTHGKPNATTGADRAAGKAITHEWGTRGSSHMRFQRQPDAADIAVAGILKKLRKG